MKKFFLLYTLLLAAMLGFLGVKIDTSREQGWISFSQAEAGPYRRSVRRTARRTARRTSRRHNYYGAPYYGGAAVVGATALAIGTVVATLPPSCRSVIVDGIRYYNCDNVYYAPQGSRYVVVEDPYRW